MFPTASVGGRGETNKQTERTISSSKSSLTKEISLKNYGKISKTFVAAQEKDE